MKSILTAIFISFTSISAMASMAEGGDGLNQGPYGTAYGYKCSINKGQVTLYIAMSPFVVDATIWDSHANKITNRSLTTPKYVFDKDGNKVYQIFAAEPAAYLAFGGVITVLDAQLNPISTCVSYR